MEPPMRMQAELLIGLCERKADRRGRMREIMKPAITVRQHCSVVKPNLWNGFHTMHMNLSMAISIVAMLDADTDVIMMMPKT